MVLMSRSFSDEASSSTTASATDFDAHGFQTIQDLLSLVKVDV